MYPRFKALENYGEEELQKLQNSTIAVVGLGATGSVIAENLARHGVNLVLIDRDYLEMNDCYSSSLYTKEQCEKSLPKTEAAKEKLSDFTEIEIITESLNPENTSILGEADLIMDGTDNLETRFLINEYCKKNNKNWIYTSALGEKGYSMIFDQNCFNCIFEQITSGTLETCETAGIMREASTIMAAKSSMKAVKLLSGKEADEKLEKLDGEKFEVKNEGCEVCNNEEYSHLESERKTVAVCGENKYQVERKTSENLFNRIKEQAQEYNENQYLIKAKINGRNLTMFKSGRAIIEARDKGHAESIYTEILGV